MSRFGCGLGQQIEPDGVVEITGVKIDGLIGTDGWDVKEEFLRQIAVWVDKTHSVALLDELEDEIAQESGLAGASLADDVGVVASIGQVKTKRQLAAPRLPHADVKIVLSHVCSRRPGQPPLRLKEHE